MISQAVSPLPKSIYMAFDPTIKHRDDHSNSDILMLDSSKKDQGMKPHFYMEMLIQIYQSIDFLKSAEISDEQYKQKLVEIKFTKPGVKKLLLLDLDETLAHCVTRAHPNEPDYPADVYIEVPTPKGPKKAGFNKRPYLFELLEAANKDYEVCCFTASMPGYADAFLDHIDPYRRLI